MVSAETNQLGRAIKSARLDESMTRNQLAAKMNISSRYLMSLENNRQKPSYDLLFRLIRELNLSADMIFYPEHSVKHPKLEKLQILIRKCGEKELNVLFATVQSLLDESP